MRVDIKALSDSELQEQGFNNTSGGMHGFGLYTDDVLSAVCITTEIPDSEDAVRFLVRFGFEKAEGKSALYKIEL